MDTAAVAARFERLHHALKIWAVSTYGLASAGPPPVYKIPWEPHHTFIVKGFNKVRTDLHNFRVKATSDGFRWNQRNKSALERFSLAADGYQRIFTKMGVDLYSDALEVLAKENEKITPVPITNTLLILGGLGFAGYIAAPQIRQFFSKDSRVPKIERRALDREIKRALVVPTTARRHELEARKAERRQRGPAQLRGLDRIDDEIEDEYLSDPFIDSTKKLPAFGGSDDGFQGYQGRDAEIVEGDDDDDDDAFDRE